MHKADRASIDFDVINDVSKRVICPRCKREAVGWPLKRRDICSPKDWIYCLREPNTVTGGDHDAAC